MTIPNHLLCHICLLYSLELFSLYIVICYYLYNVQVVFNCT